MDLARFQADLIEILRGIEHPRALAAVALAEEAGEVCRCVLDAEGYGKDARADLAGEIGDVLVALAEVATRYDLSLDACAASVLEKLRRKAPAWRAELGERLVEMRRRFDGGAAGGAG